MIRRRFFFSLLALAITTWSSVVLAGGLRSSLQVYFQATLKDAKYQSKAFGQVAAKWHPPAMKVAPAPGKKTVVQAVIGKDGKLVSIQVSTPSGSSAWDTAALNAVKQGAPFAPLPKEHPHTTVEAHFHFIRL